MKISRVNSSELKIYIYDSSVCDETFFEDIHSLMKKIQKRYSLKGFYKVIVCKKSCGIFLDIKKIDDSFYKNTLDLKIEVYPEMDVYFKTDDYFLICSCNNIWYYDKFYYVLVDDCFDKILEKVEFGDFIFGLDKFSFLNNAYVIS